MSDRPPREHRVLSQGEPSFSIGLGYGELDVYVYGGYVVVDYVDGEEDTQYPVAPVIDAKQARRVAGALIECAEYIEAGETAEKRGEQDDS